VHMCLVTRNSHVTIHS
jgi:hypothetical protein